MAVRRSVKQRHPIAQIIYRFPLSPKGKPPYA
jgi:hypothetical protein